ncbi:MAG: hypothetical protein IPM55_23890 [Acidobacteria bacterium]|nr:hypothetical protein [Acidobacteriota bacterium]
MSEMSRIVSQKIDEALHPEQVYLFYRADETRDLSLGIPAADVAKCYIFRKNTSCSNLAEHHGKAIDYPLPQKFKLPQSKRTGWIQWRSG